MLSLFYKYLRALALLVAVTAPAFSSAQSVDVDLEQRAVEATEADHLLAKADAIRFPSASFQTTINVENFRDGELEESRLYRVLSRGNENTIVLTVEPASERGQALLMRGRDLWVYMPSVSQPIRLSLSQRLTGQVANGDLARANFAGDYTASFLRNDTLDQRAVRVLQLDAAEKGVAYHRVHYWIDTENGRPLQAEFFARSGRLLKTMRYDRFEKLAGSVRPTRLTIDDALKKGRRSVLTYDSMVLRDLPEHVFTRDYLRRLQ